MYGSSRPWEARPCAGCQDLCAETHRKPSAGLCRAPCPRRAAGDHQREGQTLPRRSAFWAPAWGCHPRNHCTKRDATTAGRVTAEGSVPRGLHPGRSSIEGPVHVRCRDSRKETAFPCCFVLFPVPADTYLWRRGGGGPDGAASAGVGARCLLSVLRGRGDRECKGLSWTLGPDFGGSDKGGPGLCSCLRRVVRACTCVHVVSHRWHPSLLAVSRLFQRQKPLL